MNRKDWQNAYGNAPEDFHLRLVDTLDGLEEKKMKRRYRLSTILIAAVIMALLAGGAVAANELGVFRLLTNMANPIVPLDGAEEMVVTNLGSTENDLVTMKVEEAVFDGQNVLLQLRLTPKDGEHHVMFDWMMQNAPQDVYTIEEIDNGNGGVSIGEITRKDGKQIIDYWISAKSKDDLVEFHTSDAEDQPNGGILYWMQGEVNGSVNVDAVELEINVMLMLNGAEIQMDPLPVRIPKAGETRHAQLTPVGEQLERVEIVSGAIDFSKLEGYITVSYRYEQLPEELMGITLRFYDAEGNEIRTGGGSGWEEDGMRYWHMEMQSFDELPEKLWIEAKVIDGDPMGRVECDVTEVAESVAVTPEA